MTRSRGTSKDRKCGAASCDEDQTQLLQPHVTIQEPPLDSSSVEGATGFTPSAELHSEDLRGMLSAALRDMAQQTETMVTEAVTTAMRTHQPARATEEEQNLQVNQTSSVQQPDQHQDVSRDWSLNHPAPLPQLWSEGHMVAGDRVQHTQVVYVYSTTPPAQHKSVKPEAGSEVAEALKGLQTSISTMMDRISNLENSGGDQPAASNYQRNQRGRRFFSGYQHRGYGNQGNRGGPCFNCGTDGHFIRECPYPRVTGNMQLSVQPGYANPNQQPDGGNNQRQASAPGAGETRDCNTNHLN